MGRHTKREQSDEEPVPDDPAPAGSYLGAPPGPSFEAFSGPTDDQVFFSSYEPFPPASSAGPPPPGAQGGHGPPQRRFEPYPGDYPGDVPAGPAGRDDRVADDRIAVGAAALQAQPVTGSGGDSATAGAGQGASPRARMARLVSALPVPMLPIVALVIAVGVVAYALSTQQISLNFAGGAPKNPTGTDPRDSQVSQRGPGQRASRASRPDGLVLAFHVTSRTATAFRATGTVTNRGPKPVSRWALAFKIPNVTVGAVSGAIVVKTGQLAYVRGRAGLAPGGSARFVFTATGKPHKPTYCIMNRLACAIL
ncbi:cellulose binding domain-containing protein [Actinomadura violacea]|uniref:Cellulose binding domain-containing protein n=1 Tax=Actinomadura violacea TaxID=2819934 RepID=A0ABS3S211_9ACTN|nr:cellulose binding domain-containing protein [Actinomadura violacea]MBO2463049.1 cellulose binding domain-containing protein [Actinomadura violacea]